VERDLIPVATAATEFGISTDVIFKYLRLGRLKRYKKGMDRRTYVDRAQIKRLLKPRPVKG
jgi:hypothetical protein